MVHGCAATTGGRPIPPKAIFVKVLDLATDSRCRWVMNYPLFPKAARERTIAAALARL